MEHQEHWTEEALRDHPVRKLGLVQLEFVTECSLCRQRLTVLPGHQRGIVSHMACLKQAVERGRE